MCLCSKCLNLHCLYKTIKSTVDSNLTNSLFEYLCKSIKCHKERDTNFHNKECILGQCGNPFNSRRHAANADVIAVVI